MCKFFMKVTFAYMLIISYIFCTVSKTAIYRALRILGFFGPSWIRFLRCGLDLLDWPSRGCAENVYHPGWTDPSNEYSHVLRLCLVLVVFSSTKQQLSSIYQPPSSEKLTSSDRNSPRTTVLSLSLLKAQIRTRLDPRNPQETVFPTVNPRC